jgi:hypothetical protein
MGETISSGDHSRPDRSGWTPLCRQGGEAGFHLYHQLHQALHQVSRVSPKSLPATTIYSLFPLLLLHSIAKWLPQLYLNHTLRSTTGFSLPVVILDLIGSFTSFAELVISSWLANDLSGIWGNPLKLGLSGVTVLMDGWFIGQRLVFGQKEGADGREGERERLLRDGR